MHISEINIYPIKSLKGIALDFATIEARGLQYDRRWMLTTPEGMFFTQRDFPKMATIAVAVDSGKLMVNSEDHGSMVIPFEPEPERLQQVTVWQSVCLGEVYDDQVNDWFSRVIGTKCQLVYMPDGSQRSVNQRFDHGGDIVSFADGYPVMVIGGASLVDLNERLLQSADRSVRVPLPMNRFRPNLVVSGSEAYAEDDWKRVRIGDAEFRAAKPCERCVVTTIEQTTGEFDGKEPLKTLSSYRMAKNVMPERYESLGVGQNAVLFGQNLIAETVGATVKIGDEVVVID